MAWQPLPTVQQFAHQPLDYAHASCHHIARTRDREQAIDAADGNDRI